MSIRYIDDNKTEHIYESSSGSDIPIGTIYPFAGQTAPENYLLCDGSYANTSEYPELYEVIENIYDEKSPKEGRFQLPDLCSRVPLGISNKNINLYDMKTKTLSDGSKWARIFYHNNQSGTVYFSSAAEVKNTQTTNKYSRLYLLDDNTFKNPTTNKFEFMLCYPTNTTSYNRWKQDNSPCNEYVTPTSTGEDSAQGYEAVSIAWSDCLWGGLTRQTSSESDTANTYISGSVGHTNWWYSLGTYIVYEGGMPGYSNIVVKSDVELWVRYDNVSLNLGWTGGSSTVTLTTNNLARHTHAQNAHTHSTNTHNHFVAVQGSSTTRSYSTSTAFTTQSSSGDSNKDYKLATGTTPHCFATGSTTPTNVANTAVNQNTGGGGAHDNMQPYIILNYIIKAK